MFDGNFAGMKLAYKLIPEGLLTGSPPQNVTGTKCKNPFPAMQNNFTTSDIDKIEIYLDNALQDKSIGSRFLFRFCEKIQTSASQKKCDILSVLNNVLMLSFSI